MHFAEQIHSDTYHFTLWFTTKFLTYICILVMYYDFNIYDGLL